MKKVILAALAAMTMMAMTGCGGSGGSSSSDSYQPSYTTIEDLEFSNLTMSNTWQHSGNTYYKTMIFTNNYNPYGDYHELLEDDSSSSYYTKACSMNTSDAGHTYLCLGLYRSGSANAWSINIDRNGIVTGLYEFSSSGDTSELAYGLLDENYADAIVGGNINSTSPQSKSKTEVGSIASSGSTVSRVEIDPSVLSELDSNDDQPIAINNPIETSLDEIRNRLLD